MAGQRPGGVTLVAVLGIISGILQILGGIVAIAAGAASGIVPALVVGVVVLAIGLFTLLVSGYLLGGSRLARVLVTISFLLSIGGAVYTIVSTPDQWWSGVVSGALALIGILLLYSRRANEYFSS